MTLKEYLCDYASPRIAELGEALIESEIVRVPNLKIRSLVADHLKAIQHGDRDFRL
jgi:2-iminoacetate synthase